MNIFWFVLIVVAGFSLGVIWGNRNKKRECNFGSKSTLDEIRNESREALKNRTENRKEKILEIMRDFEYEQGLAKKCDPKNVKKGIEREDVEGWLGVSKNTALKYLNELENENKIEQVGKVGRVYYRLVE